MAIWQKPMQLKETGYWKIVEYSDESETSFRELCDCTLGHSHESEAKRCAETHEILSNPVKLAEVNKEKNCFGCKYYRNSQIPTKLYMNTVERTGTFRGTVFNEWCLRPELQSEADDYNEEYADRESAETICANEEPYYQYFEQK